MGEVYEQDVRRASLWQLNQNHPTAASQETGGDGGDRVGMDSILNFPLYWELVKAFAITGQAIEGTLDLTLLDGALGRMKSTFPDFSALGTFLENHDVPRWSGLSVDPQSLFNALTFLYMSDGIPIVYYGLEQFYNGGADPANREALWPSGYQNTTALQLITQLNKLRNWMLDMDPVVPMRRQRQHDEKSLLKQDQLAPIEKVFRTNSAISRRDSITDGNSTAPSAQVVGATKQVMAIVKGSVIGVVTNIGSPPQNLSFPVLTPYQRNVATTDMPLGVTELFRSSTRKVDVLLFSSLAFIFEALDSADTALLLSWDSAAVQVTDILIPLGLELSYF
ncbi:hypothetical protein FRC17_006686 [Serendipita sp. 399]|nr:hypothetical protein FRC17_006686 [Serendipita sp. 399]